MPEYHLDIDSVETWETLDAFTQGYLESAMWTLTDDDGNDCDDLSLSDIAEETIEQARQDCARFQEANRDMLERATEEQDRDDSAHGHDFWLTRNHHGGRILGPGILGGSLDCTHPRCACRGGGLVVCGR